MGFCNHFERGMSLHAHAFNSVCMAEQTGARRVAKTLAIDLRPVRRIHIEIKQTCFRTRRFQSHALPFGFNWRLIDADDGVITESVTATLKLGQVGELLLHRGQRPEEKRMRP